MDLTPADPSTPEGKVRMLVNRSFTLPPKFDTRSSSPVPDIGSAEGVETLFVHPHTSIVKFSTARSASGNGARGLPWTSPTETTIAAGSLEIYRVPGSVSFLHSGTLLHAILPRSQCWCVDGVSKFAMRVLPETYYRIELPGESKEELEMVEGFKNVLARVMHYEKTSCPFERNTGEELPELEDIRNRRLRPEDNAKWLDRSRLRKVTPSNSSPKQSSGSPDRIKLKKRLDPDMKERDVPVVAEVVRTSFPRSVTAPPQVTQQVRLLDQSARTPFENAELATNTKLKPFQAIPTDMPPSPPDSSAGVESVTADLVEISHALGLSEEAFTYEEAADVGASQDPADVENTTFDESVLIHDHVDEAKETEPANGESLPVSQLDKAEEAEAMNSEVTSAPPPGAELDETPALEPLKRATSNPEDPFAAIQARILARRSIGGTTSFYPSTVRESTSCSTSSVSSSASSRSNLSQIAQQRNLASALVRKACAAFIGPPAHLVSLMLRIAARFASGTFGSMFFVESPSGSARRIPGSFEVNDDFEEGISDDEDDFGVPLHSPVRLVTAKHLRERKIRDSWEID